MNDKLKHFSELICDRVVLVSFDPRRSDVKVPDNLRGGPALGLNFSHRFYIDDFEYDERGVRATLSFHGVTHFCDVPWSSVWAIGDARDRGSARIWFDDMPCDLELPEPSEETATIYSMADWKAGR